MYTFIIGLIALLLGYLIYGRFVERVFGVDDKRSTPAYRLKDDVDYIPMPAWRVYLIQFLNIAGIGPIFGAILGIMFGPAAYLWIVFGCIFMGAVHDYMSGMLSVRKEGASIPEIVGDELGPAARILMRVLSLFVLILVGTFFVSSPAGLLANMTEGSLDYSKAQWIVIWTVIIFLYYIAATLLPIDKLIGRIYPLFGIALLIMAIGVGVGILTTSGWMPEITDAPFITHHPQGLPVFPFLCITIACGAISGFHATQSPMMSRCLKDERMGRGVFYGAMITEGVVAMIWAAAAIKYASSYDNLQALITDGDKTNPSLIVNMICKTWMGRIGALLAILGVVAAPVTSGDTAFRSARLIIADFMHISQDTIVRRLILVLPLFGIAVGLMFIDFLVLWRYFAWLNQTLAMCVLWAASIWLFRKQRFYWITLLPAIFMTIVCTSYILMAKEGFELGAKVSIICGIALATVLACTFCGYAWQQRKLMKRTKS
ncbi:MAG: carbon starvation protein A [Bacteroidaceae bacterium]|nr:carbon starvation protein A [Bacteroidaceae bacterium]